MTSEALEVRFISKAVAALLALIVATLLSSVHLAPAPPTGAGAEFSMQIVRKRAIDAAATKAAIAADAAALQQASVSLVDAGLGLDVRLWLENAAGEIVFASAERYARCLSARAQRMEDADCPSASDRRRMVLDTGGAQRGA